MTDFTAPPPGMLSEQIDLPDHQMSLGLISAVYQPVIDAVEKLLERVDEINAMAAARRSEKFADMPVEGHA